MSSSMRRIKNKLSEESYKTNPVNEKEQNRYLRQIAYWVGFFVFEFNDLENTITDIAAEHIDGRLEKNDYAYIFLTGMMFNQKVELLERYYRFWINMFDRKNEELMRRTEKILVDIKAAGSIRNTIVHANYYSLDQNGNIKEKIKFAGSDAEEHWVDINRDFLVENINRLMELTEKLQELDEEIKNLM
jgi:hypothetical protein